MWWNWWFFWLRLAAQLWGEMLSRPQAEILDFSAYLALRGRRP